MSDGLYYEKDFLNVQEETLEVLKAIHNRLADIAALLKRGQIHCEVKAAHIPCDVEMQEGETN